jgi:hypothetical protein
MQTPEPLQVLQWLVSEVPRNLPVPLQVLQDPDPRQDKQRLSELPAADPLEEPPEPSTETHPPDTRARKQNRLDTAILCTTRGIPLKIPPRPKLITRVPRHPQRRG